MMASAVDNLFRVCVKLYADEPRGVGDDATAFVPIFHEWIRDGALDVVAVDVADYAHVPDGPGIVLVSHEAHFALDRSDGKFGLLAQRRTPVEGGARVALLTTLRHALKVAAGLERDRRLRGRLKFDASLLRVELNDRLHAPNNDETYRAIEPVVREVVAEVFGSRPIEVSRVANDPRDRLAVEVRVAGAGDVQQHLAA